MNSDNKMTLFQIYRYNRQIDIIDRNTALNAQI